jgi:hypothetical protein
VLMGSNFTSVRNISRRFNGRPRDWLEQKPRWRRISRFH